MSNDELYERADLYLRSTSFLTNEDYHLINYDNIAKE